MPPVYHDGREENHRCIAFCKPIEMLLIVLAAMPRPQNDHLSGTRRTSGFAQLCECLCRALVKYECSLECEEAMTKRHRWAKCGSSGGAMAVGLHCICNVGALCGEPAFFLRWLQFPGLSLALYACPWDPRREFILVRQLVGVLHRR